MGSGVDKPRLQLLALSAHRTLVAARRALLPRVHVLVFDGAGTIN